LFANALLWHIETTYIKRAYFSDTYNLFDTAAIMQATADASGPQTQTSTTQNTTATADCVRTEPAPDISAKETEAQTTQTKQADIYTVEFASPDKRIAGEVASKLLKQDSALWKRIQAIRMLCFAANLPCDFRPAHIEVLQNHEKRSPDGERLAALRAKELQDRQVALQLQVIDRKAVVIPTGGVTGYGDTHITVAYFPKDLSRNLLEQVETFFYS
jgi:hypothetical protein